MSQNGCFHTTDMALVAFLSTRSFSYDRSEKQNGRVIWYFERTGELRRELEQYRTGKARVEPKEFLAQTARIREEMYALLDHE